MKKLYIILIIIIAIVVALMLFWTKTLEPTTIEIEDCKRHYFPVVQGDAVSITCKITNTGDEPLSITDIQPSNPAIKMDTQMPGIIPCEKSEILHFTFISDRNVGYARHVIRFFGNIKPDGIDSLVFDLHIVRPSIDGSDYEELYFRNKQDNFDILVDGDMGQKEYWVDGDPDIDSSYIHSYNNKLYMDW